MLRSSIYLTRSAQLIMPKRGTWMQPRTVLRNVHCTPAERMAEKAFMRCIRRARCIKERQLRNAIMDALQRKRWLVREASATIKMYEKNLQTADKELKNVSREKEALLRREAEQREMEATKNLSAVKKSNNEVQNAMKADQQKHDGVSAGVLFDIYLDELQARRDALIREYTSKAQLSTPSSGEGAAAAAGAAASVVAPTMSAVSSTSRKTSPTQTSHEGSAGEQPASRRRSSKLDLEVGRWASEGGASSTAVQKVTAPPSEDASAEEGGATPHTTGSSKTAKSPRRRQARGKSVLPQRPPQAEPHTTLSSPVLSGSSDIAASAAVAGDGAKRRSSKSVSGTSSTEVRTATPLSSQSTPARQKVERDGLVTGVATPTRRRGGSTSAPRSSRSSSDAKAESMRSGGGGDATPMALSESSRASHSRSKGERSEAAASRARASSKRRDTAETEQVRHARRTLYEMADREKERRLAAVRGLGVVGTPSPATPTPAPPSSAVQDQARNVTTPTEDGPYSVSPKSVVPDASDVWHTGTSPTGLFRL